MSNRTWGCFDCRKTVRRDSFIEETPICPDCGVTCIYIGYQIPIPPRRDQKAWSELREQLRSEAMLRQEVARIRGVKGRHALEHEITRIEAMSENPGRQALLTQLRKQLAYIKARN
ncbi:MAG: hypothetical protein GY906_34505 [bacterium]|nr:hypothetical protein [bacterium]